VYEGRHDDQKNPGLLLPDLSVLRLCPPMANQSVRPVPQEGREDLPGLQGLRGTDPSKVHIDRPERQWDNPTMTTTTDNKKRIVLPTAKPGDVFDIQPLGEGQFILVRLERPEPKTKLTRAQCLRAISTRPLRPKMNWATLRGLTREP
jgi:hypothetical protein